MKPAPLKRAPALIRFSQEHHHGLLCVWKIRQGFHKSVSNERISRYVLHFFETDLRQHFKMEEEKLFVKLPPDNAMRIDAENDHKMIYTLIEDLKQTPGDKKLLENFADTLEKHIHFEERQLFQHMQKVFSEQQLEEIAAATAIAEPACETAWSDAFWDN